MSSRPQSWRQRRRGKFKDLNQANDVLSDPEKRQKYDQFGQHWNQPGYAEAPPSSGTRSLRLRGKGWTLPKGVFAKLQIVIPQDLSEIEQEYYEKIQSNTGFNPRT